MNSPRPPIRWNLTLTFSYTCVFLASAAYMHLAATTSAAYGFYALAATLPWSFLLVAAIVPFFPDAISSEGLGFAITYASGLLNIFLIYTITTYLQKRLRRARSRQDEI